MRLLRGGAIAAAAAVALSGCGFSPYNLPLPGGADLGSHPYKVKVQFRDVLDLVPQSAVRVNDIAVGKVTNIKLDGWTAMVTLEINNDAKLPDNADATIRQTSLLGEKFVSLAPPTTGAVGRLGNGDFIPLDRSGRNPEIEEVLSAASLLFNGGGLERTNTIVRELNKALGGNEPEVRQLIGTSTAFLAQLDDNKQALLSSLEKVNSLAVATNKQTKAITGALDDLPAALRVVNNQRDDLVKLLQSLAKLGDVATGVIQRSKADTVANLKSLVPILTNLSTAGDDLAYSFKALLTFPFTDGFLGNSVAKASGTCSNTNRQKNTGTCFGDYANLSARVDVSAAQLSSILGGFDVSPLTGALSNLPKTPLSDLPTQQLVDLVSGLVPTATSLPQLGLPGQSTPSPKTQQAPSGSTTTAPPSSGLQMPGFCSLLGKCRTAVAGAATNDVGRLLLEPVVAS